MSEMQRDKFEEELTRMSTYSGEETALWRDALERTKSEPARRGVLYSFNWRRPWLAAAAIAILASAATLVVFNSGRVQDRPVSLVVPYDTNARVGTDESQAAARLHDFEGPARLDAAGGVGGAVPSSTVQGQYEADVPATRMVIRKATIELAAEDVRTTYLRVMQIPSAARSEFIDDSSLTGNDPDRLRGSVTLRVASDRLREVLNDLRELGKVISEQAKGEDVTAQHVDLEARLRNERRIEEELLDLLSSREDAPLKDVLELRKHLEQVRGQIERLTAQREQLGRMVALATVLVIIKPDIDAEHDDDEESLGAYFIENIRESGAAGLRLLADSLGVLVHLAIGGLIWWLIAFTLIMAARAMWRRRAMAA